MSSASSVGIGYLTDIDGIRSVGIGAEIGMGSDADSSVAIGFGVAMDTSHAIAIGFGAVSQGFNSIVIGDQASVTADNETFIGNNATTSIGGSVNWTATSDGRFKQNVAENVPGLDFINSLRPVTYNYNIQSIYAFEGRQVPAGLRDAVAAREQVTYSGFIAQEVEAVAQAMGFDFSGVDAPADPENDKYGLRYAEFVVPLVKAVQELDQKVKDQQQLIEQQQAMMSELARRLGSMERRMERAENKKSFTRK